MMQPVMLAKRSSCQKGMQMHTFFQLSCDKKLQPPKLSHGKFHHRLARIATDFSRTKGICVNLSNLPVPAELAGRSVVFSGVYFGSLTIFALLTFQIFICLAMICRSFGTHTNVQFQNLFFGKNCQRPFIFYILLSSPRFFFNKTLLI